MFHKVTGQTLEQLSADLKALSESREKLLQKQESREETEVGLKVERAEQFAPIAEAVTGTFIAKELFKGDDLDATKMKAILQQTFGDKTKLPKDDIIDKLVEIKNLAKNVTDEQKAKFDTLIEGVEKQEEAEAADG